MSDTSELLHSNILCSYTTSCAATTSSHLLILQHPICGSLAQGTCSCSPSALACPFWQQQLSLVFQRLPKSCCEGKTGSKTGIVVITERGEEGWLLKQGDSWRTGVAYELQWLQQQDHLFMGLHKLEINEYFDSASKTAFPMLPEKSHVEAFTGWLASGATG